MLPKTMLEHNQIYKDTDIKALRADSCLHGKQDAKQIQKKRKWRNPSTFMSASSEKLLN